jgi:hypothetical protein
MKKYLAEAQGSQRKTETKTKISRLEQLPAAPPRRCEMF